MLRQCLLVLCVLALSACATPYQARPAKGVMGYYERQTAPERWEVCFNAQRQTDWPVIDQYLQRRAQELASAQGWSGFTVVAQHHDKIESDVSQTDSITPANYTFSAPAPQYSGNIGGPLPGVAASHTENIYQIPFSYRRGTLVITPRH